jgi:two-component system C4-dicarboxylate transport response regulator DctD
LRKKRKRPALVVVERDDVLRSALNFAFEMEGYSVAGYPDAQTALAAPLAPDACIVLDHNVPDMAWDDFLERLRAERKQAVRAVLIASRPSAETRRRAGAAGLEIVEKPLIGDALSNAVRRLADA